MVNYDSAETLSGLRKGESFIFSGKTKVYIYLGFYDGQFHYHDYYDKTKVYATGIDMLLDTEY